MRRRIWASLDDHVLPPGSVNQVGRNVANHRFLTALLRHGGFDEYHFFLASSQQRRHFQEHNAAVLAATGTADRVRLRDQVDLPAALAGDDLVVLHQSDHITRFNGLCRLRNALGARVPVTSFIHSISYQDFMSRYLEMSLAGVTAGDAIFCSSEAGRLALERCFADVSRGVGVSEPPVQRITVPLGLEDLSVRADRQALRVQMGIAPDETVALCFGRFSDFDKMDVFPLLQAFRRAAGTGRRRRLILAGAVHSQDYLRMAQIWAKLQGVDAVTAFVTDVDEADKAALFQAADFFVSIADNPQETFGLTLLEALRAGLPLLVSDWDGYREIATDDVALRVPTAWAAHPELEALHAVMDDLTFHRMIAQAVVVDVGALASGLDRLFGDAELRARLGAAARARFTRVYEYGVVIGRLCAEWDRLKGAFVAGPPTPDRLCMVPSSAFGHYATRVVGGSELVRLSAYGRRALDTGETYPLLPGMDTLIDRAQVGPLLEAAAQPVSLSALYALVPAAPRWQIRYLALWLLKHDLLEWAPPAP